jgi:hypothetical protein
MNENNNVNLHPWMNFFFEKKQKIASFSCGGHGGSFLWAPLRF